MPKKKQVKKIPFKFIILVAVAAVIVVAAKVISDNNFKTTLKSRAGTGALVAFPGAEGFGASTVGGRGGKVFLVTTLSDSGTGSLRACVEATGPRTCVFTVGGTITLSSALTISNPYLTIAGQTAPGGGITLRKSSGGDIFAPKTHDIVIRYITGRPGPGGGIITRFKPLPSTVLKTTTLSLTTALLAGGLIRYGKPGTKRTMSSFNGLLPMKDWIAVPTQKGFAIVKVS